MISAAEISRLNSRKALDRVVQERFQGDLGKFVADLSSSLNASLQTDLKQSGRFLKKIERCFGYLPEQYQPNLMTMQGRFAHYTGHSKEALIKYRAAVRQLQRQRSQKLVAQARQGLMDVQMYLGRHAEAIATGKLALNYFRKSGMDSAAARVMTNIGNVYHRLDRNKQALDYYDKARKIFEKQGGVPLAIVDFNRANVYTNYNQLEIAERLYRGVADIYRQNGMTINVCKTEYSLSYLYFLSDKYSAALSTFERVLDTFEESGDVRAAMVTRLDLAEINLQLNQATAAVMLGRQVIDDCKRLGLRYEEAKAAYFVAEALRQTGDTLEAEKYLSVAAKLFSKEENLLWLGMVDLLRSRLLLDHDNHKQAAEMARSAQRLFRKSSDMRRGIDAELSLAEIELKAGDMKGAYSRSQRLLSHQLTSYQSYAAFDLLGQYHTQLSEPEKALGYYNRAMNAVEKTLLNIYPDETRFFFAMGKYSSYLAATECLLQLGRTQDSFLQHSHALAVLNQRLPSKKTPATEAPQQLLQIRTNLRSALKKLSRPSESGQRSAATTRTMPQLEQRLWSNERKIRGLLYDSTPPEGASHKLTGDFLDRVNDDEILISYTSVGSGIGVFTRQRGKTDYGSCPASKQQLEATVRELHFLMENAVYASRAQESNDDIVGYLKLLHEWLIEPLKLHADTRTLILMLDGTFAQIPFVALCDCEGEWLKDRFKLKTIVNPDDLALGHATLSFDDGDDCAIFAPSSSELPLTGIEGSKINQAFTRARLYTGEGATSLRLKEELAQSDGFVHIAAHASRSSENPLFSRILMSDGPFFPFDLFETGVRAGLVTLSGCQTAAPGIFYGNSFSLAKAFYQAGARHVLATLWPVSDKISVVFMVEFYQVLKETSDIAIAYQTAMNKALNTIDNPAFWSAFVLLGL